MGLTFVGTENIVDIAAGSDDFNLLVRALDTAGLVETVRDLNNVTVFAPTDAAFAALAADFGYTGDPTDEDAVFNALVGALTDLGGGDPIPVLTDVLLYHVSDSRLSERDIQASRSIDTLLEGAEIEPSGSVLGDLEPDLPDPTIVASDILASNGVIQAIDRVLLPVDVPGNEAPPPAPENIVDIAAGSDDFNLLVRALDTAGLVETVRDLDDITVFAPTDAAFAALAADLGYTGDPTDEDAVFGAIVDALTDLGGGDPIPVLTNVLLYHVSAGAKSQAQIESASSVATLLEGATIAPQDGKLVDAEPDLADPTIAAADIGASNGTIQAIDKVLLPVDIPGNSAPPLDNIVDIAAGSDDFNLLVRALDTAGLVETVRDLDDVTVFAPTDAAFAALAADFGYAGDPTDEDAVFGAIVDALTELGEGDPLPVLTNVLLYHVSGGAKSAAEIDAAGSISTLLEGATFTADGGALVDAEPDFADPTIAIEDIPASNGTIQAIDRVLVPLDIEGNTTITDIVAGSGGAFDSNGDDFDLLLNAVQAADLAATLDDPNAALTVFAPNDAAFLALAQTLGYAGEDEGEAFGFIVDSLAALSGGDPIGLLTSILTYHVSPGVQNADALLGSDTISTLFGADLTVDGTSLIDADPDLPDPTIIDTDIGAANGIVHVLDGVLIPVDVLQSDGSGDVDFIIGDDTAETFATGDDNDVVNGKGGDDTFNGGNGNDIFVGGDGNDTALVSGVSSHYALTLSATNVIAMDRAADGSGTDTFAGVETLGFGDDFTFLSDDGLDLTAISGAASLSEGQLDQIVELYVAYFDRAPDALGLYYWGTELAGGMTIGEIASSFFTQDETAERLPTEDDHGGLVDAAYLNLFEREADSEGRDYWIGELANGNVSRPEFMLALINGARAETGSPADAQVVDDKVALGKSFAAVEGLWDVDDALAVNALYDRDDRDDSLSDAADLIADLAADAAGAEGSLTISLAGVIDEDFSVV
ncbi:MAG: fasciclin domain-containing protein [Pseudomonadota bacterium]